MSSAVELADLRHATDVQKLKERIREIRRSILEMTSIRGLHLGSSLSCLEIIATLYFLKMRHSPHRPRWKDRDRFILSKGHAAPALYAVLAEAGYFPKEELRTLKSIGSRLQGHPDLRTPGVDAPSGSLGQGLSIGIGMALAARMRGSRSRVYVLAGDGECDEGQVWEAMMTAAHLRLGNLVLIIDRNGWQLDDRTEEVKRKVPLRGKLESFGWVTYSINGHDIEKIIEVLDSAEKSELPVAIIAHTKKGNGVSFLEGTNKGHKLKLSEEEYLAALKELEAKPVCE
ncbi:MAG: transketolase [Candidatus Verstraetearchaeota archaeon]|nr:transketolase [Candidatus Verstraetearchaeota archaeon]